MEAFLVGLALVAYNNLLNRWPPFHGRLYVPLNLALTGAMLGLGLAFGLSLDELGLGSGQGAGLLAGLSLGVLAAAPMFLALTTKRGPAAVADDRMADFTRGEVAYRALVRVPVGTALTEELAFRGVLFALLAGQAPLYAAVWSSLFFALWHVAPGLNLLYGHGDADPGSRTGRHRRLLALVAASFVAGMILCGLRIWSGGLAAPLALHAILNSLGTVAAHLAWKRRRSAPSDTEHPA